MFADRREAGRALLKRLGPLDPKNAVILALPRGGLPVADVIAEALTLPLDIALVRKIGVPGQPEYAVGAVTNGTDARITINEDVARAAGLDDAGIRRLAERELPEIRRRRETYLKGQPPVPVAGWTVVVVDDGIATGATMRAALRLVRDAGPVRLVAAVPVGPAKTIAALERDCDEVICLECPAAFRAVGLHYRDFGQVSDREVSEIIERHAHKRVPAGGTSGQAWRRPAGRATDHFEPEVARGRAPLNPPAHDPRAPSRRPDIPGFSSDTCQASVRRCPGSGPRPDAPASGRRRHRMP